MHYPAGGSSERAISGLEEPLAVSGGGKPAAAVRVALVKGEKGLGFTITTRDNPTGGHCPIYIKNILPKVSTVQSNGYLKRENSLKYVLSFIIKCKL